jgi:spore coat protein U-like protein
MPYANHKRLRSLVLQAALGMLIYAAAASGALAATCTIDVDALNFGSVDTLSGDTADATAQVSIICSAVSTGVTAVTLCGNLGEGSGGATTGGTRTLTSGANTLAYQLYSDSGRSTRWGAYDNTALGQPRTIRLAASGGTASGSVTLYGGLSPGQASAATGTYLSSFSNSDVRFYYEEGTTLDCTAPTAATVAQASFNAQATVAANCLITVEDIDFGLHGLIDTDVTATGGLDVTCTPNSSYSIAMDGGLSAATDPEKRLMRSGTNTVTYGLYADPAHTQPWGATGSRLVTGTGAGTVQSIDVFGRVPPQSAAAGQYSDMVVVTITYF